jgi:hypothetical protein
MDPAPVAVGTAKVITISIEAKKIVIVFFFTFSPPL